MASHVGPSPVQRNLRYLLAAGYLTLIVLGVLTTWQPRLFWTVVLPLLPLAIVLMGFPYWRRICPLAFFGEAGRKLDRGAQRRVPAWLESLFFPFVFSLLLAMLVLRLVATNGDGLWLAALLLGLAVAAPAVNWLYTGKTWCNFFCPIGFVERVYTEPGSLRQTASSQCAQCTACKRHCPDIDQENAYWKDLMSDGRRVAIYAFPGLVLAFYVYYWLRHGDWSAYFDGRWTRHPADAELAFGPGFFFAPSVPAVVAAPLTLVAFSAASFVLWTGVEAAAGRFVSDAERRRHIVLALAAFCAWNVFYFFAGAPTLRLVPGGTRVLAFVAPLVATVFLVKRWRRTREHFIGDRGATRLLRTWSFAEPPPSDAAEVYGWIKASQHAREKDLEAYANTVREMIADGLVGPGELRLLEGIRKQLGISEREHETVLARLSEEERHLFDEERVAGVEGRAQLEGYRTALAEALLRGASEDEVDELRHGFGVDAESHAALLDQMRGTEGPLIARARRQLDRALELDRELRIVGAAAPTASRVFLCYELTQARHRAIERILDLLEVAGDAMGVRAQRAPLAGGDAATRRAALERLLEACPGARELVPRLETLLARRVSAGTDTGDDDEDAVLRRLFDGPDPYLRAGAAWAAATGGTSRSAALREALAAAAEDPHPLVRETATHFAESPADEGSPSTGAGSPPASSLATIEKMHLLHAVPLFAELEPEDLHDLSLVAEEETIAPPAVICEEGDTDSDALFVLVSGRAAVFLRGRGEEEATERQVRTLAPGAVIGELSVLDGSPRSATVRPSGGPVRVLRIPGQSFRSGLLARPRVSEPLLRTLAQLVRRLSDQVAGER